MFYCTEAKCNFACTSLDALDLHMSFSVHSRFLKNENLYDTLKREWAATYATVTQSEQVEYIRENLERLNIQENTAQLQMGWALSKPRTGTVRFSPKVREYLITRFNLGETTGNKADANQVSADMRAAKGEDGVRRFTREEWLTKTQIQGFFSRLAKARRKGRALPLEVEEIEMDDDQEEVEDRSNLLEEIEKTIDVVHPIVYDVFNLCELYKEDKIRIFKVAMLKDFLPSL